MSSLLLSYKLHLSHDWKHNYWPVLVLWDLFRSPAGWAKMPGAAWGNKSTCIFVRFFGLWPLHYVTPSSLFSWRLMSILMHRFLSEQEINRPFPVFVLQTPMSSATSSWQRWRFAELSKGKRKRRHKRPPFRWLRARQEFQPYCVPPRPCNTTSQRSRCENDVMFAFALHTIRLPVMWLNFTVVCLKHSLKNPKKLYQILSFCLHTAKLI